MMDVVLPSTLPSDWISVWMAGGRAGAASVAGSGSAKAALKLRSRRGVDQLDSRRMPGAARWVGVIRRSNSLSGKPATLKGRTASNSTSTLKKGKRLGTPWRVSESTFGAMASSEVTDMLIGLIILAYTSGALFESTTSGRFAQVLSKVP